MQFEPFLFQAVSGVYRSCTTHCCEELGSVLSYLSVGSGRLHLQSLVFATLDKPHSLSPFFPEPLFLTLGQSGWPAEPAQLFCPMAGAPDRGQCSRVGLLCTEEWDLLPHSRGCSPGSCSVCCTFSPSSLLAHLQPVQWAGVIPAQVQGFPSLAVEFLNAPAGSSLWLVREFWMAAQPSDSECAGLSTGLSEVFLYHFFGLSFCSLLCFLT